MLYIKQVWFIHTESGYDLGDCVYVSAPESVSGKFESPYMDEIKSDPFIQDYALATPLPVSYKANSISGKVWTKENKESGVKASFLFGDARFTDFYGMEILQGSNLDMGVSSQINKTHQIRALVNEELVRRLGLSEPVGALFYNGGEVYEIVGVVKDFHISSVYESVIPVVISPEYRIPGGSGRIVLKIEEGHRTAVTERLRDLYLKYRGYPSLFEIEFYQFSDVYKADVRFGRILALFTALGLFIVCLGLFGVSYFTAETRTKEIGVRKANGATTFEILRLLNSSTLKQVAVAFVIAVPIAYYAMGRWLENFAYKTEMSWWIFAGAGLLAGLVALATVSWQSWRAASREPVEALCYE
ncbi:hypothetical protein FUAX_39890 (plasmid) [Fulvitalea axinellae]|uniref:ABC3 transporter permease C-terminal domain-containing protein n=1 Tax=Fulvitalea axinellae TaxID=1182444 RepID=A0AAU9D1L4_9BACT|nr:hypothetical protein FUAX_39890 [Fulvitalea axinellae]